jgi:hypothetical protein
MSALEKIKSKKNTNHMKILSGISAVEVRFKKTLVFMAQYTPPLGASVEGVG